MSSFFAAAAAVDTSIVDKHAHNHNSAFSCFAQSLKTEPGTPQRAAVAAEVSSTFQRQLQTSLTLPDAPPERDGTHLTNCNARIHGKKICGGWAYSVGGAVPPPSVHVIDRLHATLRQEIMEDINEDLKRRILAQELHM